MFVTSDWTRIVDLPEATVNDVWPGVCPGVTIDAMPGTSSLPHSYLVTLFSRPVKVLRMPG